MDKRNQAIELLKVKVQGDKNHYLWVKSHAKSSKENSINDLLKHRFEEGLKNIDKGADTDKKAVIYFLRTSLDEKNLWPYIT